MRVWFLLLPLLLFPESARSAERVDFNRDIRPILSDRCFHCHGPDEEARQADLRLDTTDDSEGPFRANDPVIQPRDPAASTLWQRLTTDDESERMPPVDSHKEPLTASQKHLIKQWILQGADYEAFWAFVPPQAPEPSRQTNDRWSQQPIDQFVLAKLRQNGLQPSAVASRRQLIRRVTLDLTGLPPTRAEIAAFLADNSPAAYERLVDRLLASPNYGEHMAKYWLDLVRFADTNGIHHDHYREMTPYRDWVIRSFNENLAFDTFIHDQLAGDLYDQPTIDQQIASGFNRLHLVIDKGTALPEESFARNVVDRVSAFGTAFMGLTLQCAVCHDHKYDPVTQKEFYQLFAFFNNIDANPETPGRSTHPPFLKLPTREQRAELAELDRVLAENRAQVKRLKSLGAEQTAEGTQTASQAASLEQAESKVRELEARRSALDKLIPVTLVMKERQEIRPAHVLIRGAYDQPGEQVQRDTPRFLPPLNAAGSLKTRLDLARWLTDESHPLTARVAVNRIWQQFFGVGLVKTSEDFGAQGEVPSHPALLDHLATEFTRSGWNVKLLAKTIVLSQTYRQTSTASPEQFRADPENRWLARGSRFRLDSETIRDQILAVSGLLNVSMYGRSVKPPQPPNLWKSVSMVSSSTYAFQADTGDKVHRRSIYTFWKRAQPPPQMRIFDAPTREACIARRERTNTPLQALLLMNEAQYFKAARYLAGDVLTREASDAVRLRELYEAITSRLANDGELATLEQGLTALRDAYRADGDGARQIAEMVSPQGEAAEIDLAAYTMLINSLFSLDITKTRE